MTLFIADTNDRVRQSLASIAASVVGVSIAGEAGDVEHAIGGIKRAKPDSVIIALPMSGGSGLDVLSAAKSANPDSVAIMLTQGPCSECELKCFAMGADYFFEKSGELKKIVTTLVLLAHQSKSERIGAKREAARDPVHFLSNPLQQTQSLPSGIPATCPRITASLAPRSNTCFLARGR
jgi:DNA-binding NarL/FixJ family response regulator